MARVIRFWSLEEEMLLARSRVDVTEDPVHINLPMTTFWRRVTEKYNHEAPVSRGKEEIYSK